MNKWLSRCFAAACLFSAMNASAGTAAQTRYPIVLIPGVFAFDSIAGIDYWYRIPAALQAEGATVFVPKVNAFDSSSRRGEAVIAQLEAIKAASGGKLTRFNLMGHSQGGLTARYVMSVRPDLVASVTTMHSPHKGSPVADVVNGVAPAGTLVGVGLDVFANAVGNIVNLLSNNKKSAADIRAMLGEFTRDGAARYNAAFPAGVPKEACGQGDANVTINGNSIKLYSWGGTGRITTGVDLSDAMFFTTGLAVSEPNDGLTGRCSNHFGLVLKDNYKMNHIDVNNHLFGMTSLFETRPLQLFINHANRLKTASL